MKIKTGHYVEIICGSEKGKQGKVTFVSKNREKIFIENINVRTKHIKPRQTEDKGYIKKVECPVHCSNVKIINRN